jgi:hypothetical protein
MSNLNTLGGHNWTSAGVWQNSSGTGPQNVITSAPVGLTLSHLWMTSTDTVSREVQLVMAPSAGGSRTIGSITLAAGAGFAGVPAVDMLAEILPGQDGISLFATDMVQVSYPVAVTSGKLIAWFADGVEV